jgi:cytochrome c oxidase assembly protein subunit 15
MFKELDRGEWLSEVGRIFTYHKDLAILATLINAFLFILIIKYVKQNLILKFTYYIIAFLILQIVTGIALSYFALPPWAQALHILLATLLFSTQFYLYLILTSAKHKPIRS